MSFIKQPMKLLRSIFIIWSFLNVFIWVLSGNLHRGILYIDNYFYPIYWNWNYYLSESEMNIDLFKCSHYDISEFLVYVISPLVIYFSYKLYKKP